MSMLILLSMVACKKEVLHDKIESGKLIAGRMSGTWAAPMNMETPPEVPKEIFGNMRLVFTVDESGNPKEFLAQDCPIVFNGTTSTWTVTGTEDDIDLKLAGTSPVDELKAKIKGNQLTLTFYMGWENTETGKTGKGDFSIILVRQ